MVTRARSLLLGAIATASAIAAGNVFDEVQWHLVAAVAAAAAVMALVAPVRPLIRVPVSVLAFVGSVSATVLASGGTADDIVPGLRDGPRRLITSEWPSPGDPVVVGILALLITFALLIANELAARPGTHLAPLAPLGVAAVALIALGAPVSTPPLLVAAVGAFALVFALVRVDLPEEGAPVERPTFRADRTVVATFLGIAIVGTATSGAIALADRADPRRPQDADAIAALLDPIEASAALREADPPIDLFDIVDRSTLIGRSLPARWRTAALTEYDGQRWIPLVTLRPIGGRLGLPSDTVRGRAPSIRYSVEYRTDDIQAIPFPGRPLEVDRDVVTDSDRVVVMLPEQPEIGLTVEAVSEIDPGIVEAGLSGLALRQIDDIAVGFTNRARAITGTTATQIEQLQALESTMRDTWRLDQSAPGGQQLTLIERFVVDTNRGTEEQFVTSFVLLARALGFDARVATGFVIPPDDLSLPLRITSEHAAAWPEVRLEDGGWVAFDPVPEAESDEEEPEADPPETQSPAAAQPPAGPPNDEPDDDDDPEPELDDGDSQWSIVSRWALRVGAVAGLTILPFALVIGSIVLIKWRRRRRRRLVAEPDRRIRGEWANTTDYLIDAGLTVRPSWTDERIADAAAPLARRARFELRRLASMSTAMTFGDTSEADRLVMDALETSRMIDSAIRVEQTRGQKLRTLLSLRSLRKSTRSPVVV